MFDDAMASWMKRVALAACVAGALVAPRVARADDAPVPDTARPMQPGVHLVSFDYEFDGKTTTMPYAVYLPNNIQQAVERDQKLAMIVFMCGKGARGQNMATAMKEGPIALMKKQPGYEDEVTHIVVRPLVPADTRWENARMAGYAAAAARRVMKHYPVDPDRVHLAGMSMGGEAVWHVAMATPDMFATLVAVGGRAHPQPDKVAKALKGRTMLIVVGSGDKDFTTGSRAMRDAFEAIDADVTYVEVPGRAHNIWRFYIYRPAMYQWMLKHTRGKPIPADRANARQILFWALKLPGDPKYNDFAKNLQKQFHKFKPHWFVEHCGMVDGTGLQADLYGEAEHFVTSPLNRQFPCRIVYTAKVPAGKRTTLELTVSHRLGEQWKLIANVECHQQVKRVIGKGADHEPKIEHFSIDLTPHAGKEAFIELLNGHKGRDDSRAVWQRIRIVSEDPPAPAPADPEPSDG